MTIRPKFADQSDVTPELYRAVLGSCSQKHYLRWFARFDAAGKVGPSWHWSAFFCTLDWLVFRKMWGLAWSYAGILILLGGMIFLVAQRDPSYLIQIAQVGVSVLVLGAFALPGLYANAAYYRFCERKITRALLSNLGVPGACDLLAAQAVTRRRWWVMAALNLGGVALGAGFVALAPEAGLAEKGRLWMLGETAMLAGATLKPAGPVAEGPVLTSSSPVAASPEVRPSSDPSGTTVNALPANLPPMAEGSAAEFPNTAKVPLPGSTGPRYFIQIGAFADERNVRKLADRLHSAGLTPLIDTVQFKIGPVKRVRIGPFLTQEQADAVGVKVKDMGLPVHLVKQ